MKQSSLAGLQTLIAIKDKELKLMKKKLLFTTALVAVLSTVNVYAATIIDPNKGGTGEFWDNPDEPERKHYNASAEDFSGDLTVNGNGNLTVYANGMDVEVNEGQTITLNQGKIHANGDGSGTSLVISGGTVNVNGPQDYENDENDVTFTGEGILMSGGTVNLNGGGISDDSNDSLGFTMTGGTINIETSAESHAAIGSEGKDGAINIEGGTINVDGGIDVRNSQLKGSNYMQGSKINLSGGELNINSGANLKTFIGEDINNKSTINLTDNGTINLAGGLRADISGNGNLNVKSSSALVDGDVSSSNLTFEADHSLSKLVSGTIGDLASLNVNKGTLTYDKQTGKIGNLNVAGGLDIGTNTVNTTNVDFKDNSNLALRVAATDNYGKINADNITIGKDTTMKVTLDNGVVGNGENTDLKFLNGKVTGSFTNKIAENSRYDIKWNEDGSLNITGTATASDVVVDAGGSANNAKTAEAWDSVTSSTTASAGAKAVASVLGDLSQNATTAAGQKAYVDALTAVAPEVAPMVQKTQTETANQVFGVVSTRLTGGSISTGSEGMSSGDSNPDAAVWVQGMFNKSKLDDTSKAKGFDVDSNGVALGIEKFVNKDVKVGAGYAYTNTDIDGFMRSTDVDTHTAILYREYKPSNWYVNGIATYGWSDYSEDKNVAGVGVKADYDVETFGLQAMTGYDMNVNGLGVTPEAGLRYVHIKQDTYKDSADQRVFANDSDILTGVIGAKVSKNFELSNGMNIKPEARIAATYDLFNDDVNSVVTLANGSAYAVEGEALDRFGMEFGAGVTAEVNDNVEFSLGYEGKFREDYQDHTGLINAKYKF